MTPPNLPQIPIRQTLSMFGLEFGPRMFLSSLAMWAVILICNIFNWIKQMHEVNLKVCELELRAKEAGRAESHAKFALAEAQKEHGK